VYGAAESVAALDLAGGRWIVKGSKTLIHAEE
jgi:hypothetical protein